MAANDLSESKITNMNPVMEQIFTKMIPCPGAGNLKIIPCSAARPRIEKYMSTSPGGTGQGAPKASALPGSGSQESDLLTPRHKPAKLLKLLNPYLENRLSVACVESLFRVN